jgi:tRNA threonylcarbamoyladenosine biosynthesis protein TsaB
MKILAIDTSTLLAGVAVWDGRVLAERRQRVTTHSEQLLALVDEALREAGVAPAALDGVACAAGPGSFTGLRIGLATCKGLCFALGKPLALVPTLEALAARGDGPVCATLDAHKGEVYAGFFNIEGADGRPKLDGEEWVGAPNELAARLIERTPLTIVGDGVLRYRDLLVAGVTLLDEDGAPRPGDLARLAAERLTDGRASDLASSGPHYIRASEAEIAKMKSK